jgi:hypothetical protein
LPRKFSQSQKERLQREHVNMYSKINEIQVFLWEKTFVHA